MSALGCASKYRAVIHGQRGAQLWVPLVDVAACTWSRVLDDVSDATVVIPKASAGAACCTRLGDTRPWGHELTIYRDDRLVWQGPVRKVTETRTQFTIYAQDVFAWLDRRVNQVAFSYQGVDMAQIADGLIHNALATNDPGILQYLRVTTAGIGTSRAAGAEQVYVGAEIRELANSGLDFTTLGRALVISGELNDLTPRTALIAGRDVAGDAEVERTGTDITRAIVVGEGVTGTFGGDDPFLGRLDSLSKAQGTLDTTTANLHAQMLVTAYAPPVTVVRLPDDAWLVPEAPVTIDELMCGNRIDVATPDLCIVTSRTAMRLTRVSGSWGDGGERIGISLAPYVDLSVPPKGRGGEVVA